MCYLIFLVILIVLLLLLFYFWGKWDIEKLSDMFKIIKFEVYRIL